MINFDSFVIFVFKTQLTPSNDLFYGQHEIPLISLNRKKNQGATGGGGGGGVGTFYPLLSPWLANKIACGKLFILNTPRINPSFVD